MQHTGRIFDLSPWKVKRSWGGLPRGASRSDAAMKGLSSTVSTLLPTDKAQALGWHCSKHLSRGPSAQVCGQFQSGVFPENERSLALHERVGFRRVGTRERLGKLNGQWRDVVLLERRSNDIE